MRSKAQIKGHPIHPILVGFPIAFFIGTLLFDILAQINDRPDFSTIAYYLEITGIISALLTAVPGIIDYFYTIPPNSSGKKRGTQHGLINITVVILFTIAWFYRKGEDASVGLILALETVGVIGLFISGWLGGTLVYRNQIGVDPRYAHAGKWKECTVHQERGAIEVAEADELKVNQMKLIRLKDKRIVLGKTENGYVAFDDRCTHRGGSLAGGAMICGTVQCPWHGSQFSVTTGEVKAGPAKETINTYTVNELNGKVLLTL
jgi:uncharacterized membrane protein/nitrite reductase/ring-hydroxylating ferredoxin subunit